MTAAARSKRRLPRYELLVVALMAVAVSTNAANVHAQQGSDSKPYDDRLNRLAELLGATHYLRELCGASDGSLWRDHMKKLIDAEATSLQRRARLTKSFNSGYTNYSRSYKTCTPSAQQTIGRFLTESVQLSETLAKTTP